MKGIPVDIWYFNPSKPPRQRRGIYSPHKVFLHEVIYRSLTQHNSQLCCWTMKLLPRLTTLDSYVLFRVIMIMIHSVDTKRINKNFIIYLETLLSKLNLTKPDIFIEFLTYLLGNNRVEDARELFGHRHRFMSYLYHRQIPQISINMKCYEFLFNYLEWKNRMLDDSKEPNFDVSIQGWLVNAMDPLKCADSNHELFVMCIVNVLLFHNFHKKAYLFLSEFQRSNPDNMPAQLLLFNLIKTITTSTTIKISNTSKRRRIDRSEANNKCDSLGKLISVEEVEEKAREENRLRDINAMNNFSSDECNALDFELNKYPTWSDNRTIFDNLLRLDPRREEILELSVVYATKLETLQIIMDSLEFVSEIRNPNRWRNLQDILNEIISSSNDDNEKFLEDVRKLWQTRYQKYWHVDSFLTLAIDETSGKRPKHRKVIRNVIQILSSQFDKSIEQDEDEQIDWINDNFDQDLEWD